MNLGAITDAQCFVVRYSVRRIMNLLSPWTIDLQNPPEEIPGLLAKLAEGYDVVYGTPERGTTWLVA